MSGQKRLQKEFIKLEKEPESGITIKVLNENILTWEVTCQGPKKSAYEDGFFKFSFKFEEVLYLFTNSRRIHSRLQK
jgi:ubiquitin-protein ligase